MPDAPMSDAAMETSIRAEWKREGIPTDYMDGGARTVTAWERAAYRAACADCARACEKRGQNIADAHLHQEYDTGAMIWDNDLNEMRAEETDDCAAACLALAEGAK